MAEFYLVRHGQASFGAANYDKLSDLGHQQSEWLGHYFAQRDIGFDQVFVGEMVRHHETAQGIARGMQSEFQPDIDDGLNEFDFKAVIESFLHRYPEHRPSDNAPPPEYYKLLKKSMHAWLADDLEHSMLSETWQQFEQRVQRALARVCNSDTDRPVLVVSSGGAMSMIMKQVLGFDASKVIDINLQTRNASFSHFYFNRNGIRLSSFNSVPHLDTPERADAITYS